MNDEMKLWIGRIRRALGCSESIVGIGVIRLESIVGIGVIRFGCQLHICLRLVVHTGRFYGRFYGRIIISESIHVTFVTKTLSGHSWKLDE
jgi:hypothetical protein